MTSIPQSHAADQPDFALVTVLLKAEAAIVTGIGIVAYYHFGFSWWIFAGLILAPDLSAIGYAAGPRVGAWTYDLAHNYTAPSILALVGYLAHEPLLFAFAAIWVTHIGGDRLMGYGLKFSGDPRDTHLSRLSRRTQ